MSQTAKVRVDRDDELALLVRLACSETPTRIALIQAESGMGKSELVREFRERCPKDLPLVVVDFKGGGLSLADVLFHIYDTLGWKRFPTLAQAIQNIVRPTQINVTGNVLIGQNEISIALGGPDEQTRELHRNQLTTALVTDLRALDRVVLIVDVFEKCDAVLRAWLTSLLLPAIHRSQHLTIIVAGQQVPECTQMWECEQLLLEPIAPKYWQIYARAVGAAALSLDFIEGCCVALKGHCLSIANTLESQGGRRV